MDEIKVFDTRGNGGGGVVPTITGDHENRVTDNTALLVVEISHDLFSTKFGEDGKANTLAATDYKEPPVVCYSIGSMNSEGMLSDNPTSGIHETKVARTIDANGSNPAGYQGGDVVVIKKRKYILRRLTPLECCRLQGFPDWWTDGVEGSDTAKYKMWGNGIALPCAADVIGRIAKEINENGNERKGIPQCEGAGGDQW